MTVKNLVDAAAALIREPNADTYADGEIDLVNLVLAENTRTNDALRRRKGLAPLGVMPAVSLSTDTLPTEDELNRPALAYALASRLSFDDNDMARTAHLHELYIMSLKDLATCRAGKITDVYGGEEA